MRALVLTSCALVACTAPTQIVGTISTTKTPTVISTGPDCEDPLLHSEWVGDVGAPDVATFCEGYCTRTITGDLVLSQSMKTDLSPLSCLTEIDGTLGLYGNEALTSLAGLDSLVRVGGDINIWGSPLTDLSGLEALESIGGTLQLSSLSELLSLSALGRLESIGLDLSIRNIERLSSLEGLENIERIEQMLYIDDDDGLTSLTGLESLEHIGTDALINGNDELTSLTGLSALEFVGETLSLYNNDGLLTLSGLEALERVEETVAIHGNDNLSSLTGLEGLRYIGSLEIGAQPPVWLHPDSLPGNAVLNDATALYGLLEVQTDIAIDDNPMLTPEAIQALIDEIDTIGGDVFLFDN